MKSIHQPKEIREKYYLFNGKVLSTDQFDPEDITKKSSVYEVIRILLGVPLFLEEHLERLRNSLNLLNAPFQFSDLEIKHQIDQLVKRNKCHQNNIKIVVNDLNSKKPNLFLFFISSFYPTKEQYAQGVHTILYSAERENPNVKMVAQSFRERVSQAIHEARCYEAILLNQKGEITEGSRSNIFLVKGNHFYTAPSKSVLIGITRNRIIKLCQNLGIPVIEEPIPVSFLEEVEGLFLTGTSPKVLPIAAINNKKYNSPNNSLIKQVQQEYDHLIENYIAQYTKP